MAPTSWKRLALPASVLLIASYWTVSAWAHLFRKSGSALPGSVGGVAVYVCLKAALVLGVVSLLLAWNGERLAGLGLTGASLKAALVWGPLLAAGAFLLTNVVLGSVLRALGTPARTEALPALFRDPREAPLWVLIAIAGGGFGEELLRAFVLTRFDGAFGRIGLVAALVVDTFVFGLGHLYQGVTGAIQAGVSGLLFAIVFLKRRRVADAIVVHAIFDLFGIALAYLLYAGRR